MCSLISSKAKQQFIAVLCNVDIGISDYTMNIVLIYYFAALTYTLQSVMGWAAMSVTPLFFWKVKVPLSPFCPSKDATQWCSISTRAGETPTDAQLINAHAAKDAIIHFTTQYTDTAKNGLVYIQQDQHSTKQPVFSLILIYCSTSFFKKNLDHPRKDSCNYTLRVRKNRKSCVETELACI